MKIKLEVKNLNFSYNEDKIILKNLSFKLYSGEFVGIKGINGCGKTTLLKILSGIIKPDDVEYIKFNDKFIKKIDSYKKNIAYIPDNPFLYDELTGNENIEVIMNLWKEKSSAYLKRVFELAEFFNIKKDLNTVVKKYSLGMKNKLYLISMLSRDISLIFLDEPFSTFDVESQKKMSSLLTEKKQKGLSILFTSHIQEIQNTFSDRILYFNKGTLKEEKDVQVF